MLKEIIAILATALVTLGYIPQIIRGYKRKSLKDVSMSFLMIIASGVVLWIIYSILNKDIIFFFANVIVLACAITLISMKLYYQKGRK